MEKHRRNSNFSKKTTSKSEVKVTLSEVAERLKGKELFPEKMEKAKSFFSKLELASK